MVLACLTTASLNASCLRVHPSECQKYTAKNPHTPSDTQESMSAAVSEQGDEIGGSEIDVPLLTFVDDSMDIMIERTPVATKLRDTANDKNLHENLEESDASWSQAKMRVSSDGWSFAPERIWPNVTQERCWDQVVSLRRSGISDVGWKWEEV